MLSDRKELAPCLSRRMVNHPANRVSLHSTDNRNNHPNMDSRNRLRRAMARHREATSRSNRHLAVISSRPNNRPPHREATSLNRHRPVTSNNMPPRPFPNR
jgi:hypothetical protein